MYEARMGRAFSIHTFAGFLGGAVAPAIVAALVAITGGYGALIVAGSVGALGGLLVLRGRHSRCQRRRPQNRWRTCAAAEHHYTGADRADDLLHVAQPVQRRDRQF